MNNKLGAYSFVLAIIFWFPMLVDAVSEFVEKGTSYSALHLVFILLVWLPFVFWCDN